MLSISTVSCGYFMKVLSVEKTFTTGICNYTSPEVLQIVVLLSFAIVSGTIIELINRTIKYVRK